MKKLLLLSSLLPLLSWANYQKPTLIARYTAPDGLNAPGTLACFTSGPAVTANSIYLGCLDENGPVMVQWKDGQYSEAARATDEHIFSMPSVHRDGVSWYESDENTATRAFNSIMGGEAQVFKISHLAPAGNFLAFGTNRWIYQSKSEAPQLWSYSANGSLPFFSQEVAYIFTPVIGSENELVIKVRKGNWDESSPDELWMLEGKEWKKILDDKDANPTSRYRTFRHQMAVSNNKVLVFATDERGESLLLIENGKMKEIARPGKEIKSFDHFSPKMRGETIVFRGVDSEDRKSVWYFVNGKIQKLLTQGDIIHTDKGPARVHYKSEHAILYGSPGIGPRGEIVLQATLTDADYPSVLLGVGLIKFHK